MAIRPGWPSRAEQAPHRPVRTLAQASTPQVEEWVTRLAGTSSQDMTMPGLIAGLRRLHRSVGGGLVLEPTRLSERLRPELVEVCYPTAQCGEEPEVDDPLAPVLVITRTRYPPHSTPHQGFVTVATASAITPVLARVIAVLHVGSGGFEPPASCPPDKRATPAPRSVDAPSSSEGRRGRPGSLYPDANPGTRLPVSRRALHPEASGKESCNPSCPGRGWEGTGALGHGECPRPTHDAVVTDPHAVRFGSPRCGGRGSVTPRVAALPGARAWGAVRENRGDVGSPWEEDHSVS